MVDPIRQQPPQPYYQPSQASDNDKYLKYREELSNLMGLVDTTPHPEMIAKLEAFIKELDGIKPPDPNVTAAIGHINHAIDLLKSPYNEREEIFNALQNAEWRLAA